jgi:hypothetical protein
MLTLRCFIKTRVAPQHVLIDHFLCDFSNSHLPLLRLV